MQIVTQYGTMWARNAENIAKIPSSSKDGRGVYNPEAWGTNLVLFDPIPQHELTPVEVMEFGEPDHDIFSIERWPLILKGSGMTEAKAI